MRQHLDHLGVAAYTHRLKRIRAQRLKHAFPRYDSSLLVAYSNAKSFRYGKH